MTFKCEFEAKAGFDPFDQMTIASACNRYLRTHCLQRNTIACEPLLGWGGRRVNQSSVAFEWLAWEAHLVYTPLRHAHNGGEVRPLPNRCYTVDGFDAMTQTVYEFDGCFWHGCRPVFHNATNCIPDSLVVPWTSSSPYVKKNTTFFVNMATSSGRSGNASGRIDVPPILPSKPSWRRTRPLARSIRAMPSSVDVPTPTNSTGAWKGTNVSFTTISRGCTLTSTSTAATPSVILRSSPNHLSNKGSTRISARVLYHLTTHRSIASRLAVPMQSETHVPIVCHLRPPVHQRPTTRQARRRLPSQRRSMRSHRHVVHA